MMDDAVMKNTDKSHITAQVWVWSWFLFGCFIITSSFLFVGGKNMFFYVTP